MDQLTPIIYRANIVLDTSKGDTIWSISVSTNNPCFSTSYLDHPFCVRY